ncbi:hypothetical protein ACVW1C_000105 [Bradyrhizobium sp. USDA 4011]
MTSPKKVVVLESLAADRQKEHEGDWIKAKDLDPNIRWFVRSTNFPEFKTARDAEVRELSAKYDGDPIPEDVNAEVMGRLAVEHLLMGWDGLDVPFSQETAQKILTDEDFRKVRWSVYLAASQVGVREVRYTTVAAKN